MPPTTCVARRSGPVGKSQATRLCWSERGAIACLADAPFRGSDHWVWERWRAMTTAEIEGFTTEVGRTPCCECCGIGPGDTSKEIAMTTSKKSPKTSKAPKTVTTKTPKPAPAEKAPKAPGEDLVVFAFRLTAEERDAIHRAAGPAKASKFARTLLVAAARNDEGAVRAILKSAQTEA